MDNMPTLQHQQPHLDGLGPSGPIYDHQYLGFDRAPYGTLYLPAYPTGPYLQNLNYTLPSGPQVQNLFPAIQDIMDETEANGLSSDEDPEDSAVDEYMHVELDKTAGTQLAVWSYHLPDTLAIFTPIPGDTMATVISFAQSALKGNMATDHALLLLPGAERLTEPAGIHTISAGSSVLLVPKYDYLIHVEITQLKVKLKMAVNITMTVSSLKAQLQYQRGLPMERMDLLFHDQPLENQRHLFDYCIADGSTVFVLMQLVYDICITVQTFWGKQYKMYVDPCMTTAGLVNMVLRRTITQQAGDVSHFFHLFLPRHALVMYSPGGVSMKWTSCLGLYGVEDEAVFQLSTIALAYEMSLQKVPVLLDSGEIHNFLVSKFDYWSVLALKLHGMLGYPVNLLRLFHGKRELDLASAVGRYSHHTPAVRVDFSSMCLDADISHGIQLTFQLGNGICEVITCSPTRTVYSVKIMLEEIGIPNATFYDLFVDGYQLPSNGRIGKVIEEYRKPLDLKLQHYHIFVHSPNTVIYDMKVHANETVKVFRGRVERKTGLASSDYYLLVAGLPLSDNDSIPMFKTPLAIRSSVFLMNAHQQQTFFVTWDDWLVKLRLPFHPKPSEVKKALWNDNNIPDGSLASLGNFLQWFFTMREKNSHLPLDATGDVNKGDYKLKPRQRYRGHKKDNSEDNLWKYKILQIKQLQNVLEKHHSENYKAPQLPPAASMEKHHHRHMKKQPIQQARHQRKKIDIRPTHRSGTWKRLNPEDLVESYLKAWSLPLHLISTLPPMAHAEQHRNRHIRPRSAELTPKYLASLPRGQSEPQWTRSLGRKARSEQLQPSIVKAKGNGRYIKSQLHAK